MPEHQLDLFADPDGPVQPAPPLPDRPRRAPSDMDDAALIAAIPDSGVSDGPELAAEAGRRQLVAAIPALEALCRRFTGFGAHRLIPEQAAALRALAAVGGHEAAQAVARLIGRSVEQGPGLAVAVEAAASLGASLPDDVARALLQHPDAGVRASACYCVPRTLDFVPALARLLDDPDRTVVRSAACTLGRMGRLEARLTLKRLLHDNPAGDVIEAVVPVADEDCIVLLGRIARTIPALSHAALEALDDIDHPRAATVAAAVRRALQP